MCGLHCNVHSLEDCGGRGGGGWPGPSLPNLARGWGGKNKVGMREIRLAGLAASLSLFKIRGSSQVAQVVHARFQPVVHARFQHQHGVKTSCHDEEALSDVQCSVQRPCNSKKKDESYRRQRRGEQCGDETSSSPVCERKGLLRQTSMARSLWQQRAHTEHENGAAEEDEA